MTYLSHTPECIRVTASDALGHSADTDVPRSAFKTPDAKEINVAVFRKPEWAQELNVEVASFAAASGDRCSGTVLERRLSLAPISVTPGKVSEHEVKLQARDDDGDGHVLKTPDVLGTDCMDLRKEIHSGAAEVCNGTEDFDCDGLKGCEDSDCLDAACDDNNPCTVNDVCTRGGGSVPRCQGTPKQCAPPNLMCYYTTDSTCDPETGNCIHIQRPVSTVCNDNNPCTLDDECGRDGACGGTSEVSCNNSPGQCYESAGTCRVADGQCDYPFKASTASCDDSSACTTNDTCNGSGDCGGQPLAPCQPSTVCHKSERLGCPASADCTESVDAAKVNTPCDVPPRSGVCRPDGACSKFPYIPSNFDPDDIAAATGTGPGTDLHITCGTPANPIICDTGIPGCSPPPGCSFPTELDVRIITQGGVDTLLLPVRHFIMDPGTAVKLRGTRPLIIAVYGNATIHGALLADADMEVPGAGGNRAACVPSQNGKDGQFGSGEGSGGGGGGFGSAGGLGGKNASDAQSGGGATLSSTLVPLVGGCQGGRGGGNASGGLGGGGGGALQLSVAGTLQ
ncbi:MAG TPA: hypothetical protein VNA24_27930, partial [Hyalangium sp.]|nr:hypothetical protein [Hyalangium sp.]